MTYKSYFLPPKCDKSAEQQQLRGVPKRTKFANLCTQTAKSQHNQRPKPTLININQY